MDVKGKGYYRVERFFLFFFIGFILGEEILWSWIVAIGEGEVKSRGVCLVELYLFRWKGSKIGKDFMNILLYSLKEIKEDIDRNIFWVYGLGDLVLNC